MSKLRVAVAGGGQLGVPLIKVLLNSSFKVTLLTRSTTQPSAADFPLDNPDFSCATVDYESVESLTAALKNHFAVVCAIATASLAQQRALIDAAVAAGVSRFIPGEFGCNTADPAVSQLVVFSNKVFGQKYLAEQAAQHLNFSYTLLFTGPWLDLGLSQGYILDVRNRKGTFYDDGNVPISTTTLRNVTRAIAAILNPAIVDKVKNRAVYVHDTVITQNKAVKLANKHTGKSEKDWHLTPISVEEMKQRAEERLQQGDKSALISLIRVAIFGGDKYGGDFSKIGTDNELLGLPVMSDEDVENVVKDVLES